MTGDTHYDLEILARLAEDLLDAAMAGRVRAHLAVCDACGERLADLAAVREVLAATPTPAMPMGVALRIDRALAAETDRRSAVGVADAPNWDDLMRGAPWETAAPAARARSVQERERQVADPVELEPIEPPAERAEPVRLGVVADDGSVVPARSSRRARQAPGRRRWAMPAVAASVAAAVIGATAVTTSMLAASGGTGPGRAPLIAQPPPSAAATAAGVEGGGYVLRDSGYNYTDAELRGPLVNYIAPAGPVILEPKSEDPKLTRCIDKVSAQVGMSPFAVDQGQYNGKDATIMAFRTNGSLDRMRVYVVGPECEQLRKPGFASWE